MNGRENLNIGRTKVEKTNLMFSLFILIFICVCVSYLYFVNISLTLYDDVSYAYSISKSPIENSYTITMSIGDDYNVIRTNYYGTYNNWRVDYNKSVLTDPIVTETLLNNKLNSILKNYNDITVDYYDGNYDNTSMGAW